MIVVVHNFLDLLVARKLGSKSESTTTMSVTTGGGDGHQLEAPYICKGFQWTLENVCFIVDVIVLPLACCELILRVK